MLAIVAVLTGASPRDLRNIEQDCANYYNVDRNQVRAEILPRQRRTDTSGTSVKITIAAADSAETDFLKEESINNTRFPTLNTTLAENPSISLVGEPTISIETVESPQLSSPKEAEGSHVAYFPYIGAGVVFILMAVIAYQIVARKRKQESAQSEFVEGEPEFDAYDFDEDEGDIEMEGFYLNALPPTQRRSSLQGMELAMDTYKAQVEGVRDMEGISMLDMEGDIPDDTDAFVAQPSCIEQLYADV